jgi:hypothetical protein
LQHVIHWFYLLNFSDIYAGLSTEKGMESKNLCPSTTATAFACHSIINAFAENIYELAHLRKEWNINYAASLKKEAQEILNNLTTSEHFKQTLEKLKIWRELMISSLTAIGIVRASVKNDYKDDKAFQKEFYQKLGYNDYFSDAKNGDHYSMFLFVRVFADNLTPEMREKILCKGLDHHIVDRIVFNSKQLESFQECFDLMNDKNLVASEDQLRIEQLYGIVRDISRIATAYYYFEPVKRDNFNFFKALRNIKKEGVRSGMD